MTSEKAPAAAQPPQENADTASVENINQHESGRRFDRLTRFANALPTKSARAGIAVARAARHYAPRVGAAIAGTISRATARTRTAFAQTTRATGRLFGSARTKFARTKTKPRKPDSKDDRFAEVDLAEVDPWGSDPAEFSLAKNRVIGFMVGLAAGVLVAWIAIGLVEQPRLVTGPLIAGQNDTKAKPRATHNQTASDRVWGEPAPAPVRARAWKTETADDEPRLKGLPAIAHQDLTNEAKDIGARGPNTPTKAALVDPAPETPPAFDPGRLPPLPTRNASRQTVIIELPPQHPARNAPPPPAGIEARAVDQFGNDTRMGLGLGNLTIERPPPVQRPAPASSP